MTYKEDKKSEGAWAYHNGFTVSANPYGPSLNDPQVPSAARAFWHEGFMEAANDDVDNEPLALWERELLTPGVGTVVFTRTDGKTVSYSGVRVDSVGPSAENSGVVGVEFDGPDRLVHVPFVESWEFEY